MFLSNICSVCVQNEEMIATLGRCKVKIHLDEGNDDTDDKNDDTYFDEDDDMRDICNGHHG